MPAGLAENYARKHLSAVLPLLPHFRERFNDPTLPPIQTHIGYMRDAIRDPGTVGAEQDGHGGWKRPAPEGEAARQAMREAKRRAEDAQRASEQAKAEQNAVKEDAAHAEYQRRLERWQSLPEAVRETIRQNVRRDFPFFRDRGDSHYSFLRACFDAMEAQGPNA